MEYLQGDTAFYFLFAWVLNIYSHSSGSGGFRIGGWWFFPFSSLFRPYSLLRRTLLSSFLLHFGHLIMAEKLSSTELLSQPLTLPCGLVLPNRLVKCPMQETLAEAPFYDPPVEKFQNLYGQWAKANYGLIITGQVQIDPRCMYPSSLPAGLIS